MKKESIDIRKVYLFNFADNKLYGSPVGYDTRTTRKEQISNFYSEMFDEGSVDLYLSEKSMLLKSLEEKTFLVFHGGAGRGKTTFLNYIANKDEETSKKYVWHFIDLVAESTRIENNLGVILENEITSQLQDNELRKNHFYKMYPSDKKNVSDYLYFRNDANKESLFRDFIRYEYYKDNTSIFPYLTYPDFFNTLKSYNNESLENYWADLLYIYFVNCILINENEYNQKPFIFVIDNLDELSQEFIGEHLLSLILNAYSDLESFGRNVNLQQPIEQQVHFIVSLRDVNTSLLTNYLSVQALDRWALISTYKQFDSQCNKTPYELLYSRLNYFLHKSKELNQTDYDDGTKAIIEGSEILLYDKKFIQERVAPMINYDSRIFMLKILELFRNEQNKSFLNMTFDEYKAVSDVNKEIARGIIYNAFFNLFYSQPQTLFYRIVEDDINPKEGQCHRTRIGLTLAYNLSIPSKKKNIKEYPKINEDLIPYDYLWQKFSLEKLCNSLQAWYDTKEIKNIATSLFNLKSRNYEKFALISPGNINLNTYFDKTNGKINENIIGAFESYIDENIEKRNYSKLSDCQISLLPAGMFYAYYLFINYEYHNLMSFIKNHANKREDFITNQSLFQYIKKSSSEYGNADISIENIKKRIREVFESIKEIISNASDYFCKIYRTSLENGEKFCDEKHKQCVDHFIKNNYTINKTLFSTRLISNHITYLDNFRKYIHNSNSYSKDVDDKGESNFGKINKVILEIIGEYINLYFDKKAKDSTNLMFSIKKKLLQNYDENFNYSNFTKSVKIDKWKNLNEFIEIAQNEES